MTQVFAAMLLIQEDNLPVCFRRVSCVNVYNACNLQKCTILSRNQIVAIEKRYPFSSRWPYLRFPITSMPFHSDISIYKNLSDSSQIVFFMLATRWYPRTRYSDYPLPRPNVASVDAIEMKQVIRSTITDLTPFSPIQQVCCLVLMHFTIAKPDASYHGDEGPR